MSAIDGWLEGLVHGGAGVGVILLVSLLLGLRHATDPDHLAAVTTLVASEEHERVRRASFMGLAWGLGHGTTLVLIGLPLVLLNSFLPEVAVRVSEAAIGAIIVALALRLLLRWRRGLFHAHAHTHPGGGTHRHLHSHAEGSGHSHDHTVPGRSPLTAYGVGLVHGVGGSGGLTLLLLSTISGRAEATAALLLFAAGTAASMALLSTALGLAIAAGPISRHFERIAPVLGSAALLFGLWYALGALGLLAYPL